MAIVIGVRFKEVGKIYYFDPDKFNIEKEMAVVVETSRGVELGYVTSGNHEVSNDDIVAPLKKVIRIATEADVKASIENKKKEAAAFDICNEKIANHKIDMKLVAVEYTFDLSKILFYFTADGRVDFRELVKDLASVFKTRIELRQIGVRDEAKMLGGLGMCGNPLCCSTFLSDFEPVSINMAKDQGLSLNPTKISGTCGRLMCCLKYEQEGYEYLAKNSPRVDSQVSTPEGNGTVVDVSLLKGTCRVRMEKMEAGIKNFSCEECRMQRRAKRETPVENSSEKTEKSENAPVAKNNKNKRRNNYNNNKNNNKVKTEEK